MRSYDSYKSSGIDWMGDIPLGWELRKVSRSFNLIGSGTTPNTSSVEYYTDGDVPWVNTGDLNNYYLNETNRKISAKALDDHSTLRKYPKDSFIIAMYGATIGKVSLLGIDACVNQACCVLGESKYFKQEFIYYWFQAVKEHIINLSYGGGQPNISQEIIRTLKVPCPSINEQNAIINFLNFKCKQVDDAVSKKHLLIRLLQEEKAALINQAVTKGIDEDVPMKPSGMEWLGDIPAHWELIRLKNVAEVNPKSKSFDFTKNSDQEVVFLPMEKVTEDGEISCDLKKSISTLSTGYTYFEKNDIIVAKITPCFENGKGALLDLLEGDFGFGSTEFHVIRSSGSVMPDFLYLLTKSDLFMQMGEASMTGAAGQKRVPTDFISNFIIGVPERSEQRRIVNFIMSQLERIDTAILKISREIELLEEYKQSLIYEVVTGKVKVDAPVEEPLETAI